MRRDIADHRVEGRGDVLRHRRYSSARQQGAPRSAARVRPCAIALRSVQPRCGRRDQVRAGSRRRGILCRTFVVTIVSHASPSACCLDEAIQGSQFAACAFDIERRLPGSQPGSQALVSAQEDYIKAVNQRFGWKRMNQAMHHVVVVGAGFGGLELTGALARRAGAHHHDRQAQPPPFPAAALSGRDDALATSEIVAHPPSLAQAQGRDDAARHGQRSRPRAGKRVLLDDGGGFPTTRSCWPRARATHLRP